MACNSTRAIGSHIGTKASKRHFIPAGGVENPRCMSQAWAADGRNSVASSRQMPDSCSQCDVAPEQNPPFRQVVLSATLITSWAL